MSISSQNISTYSNRTASALALFIGMMSVLAGSMVLLSIDTKDYNILTWLVGYNVILGFISIFAAFIIWQGREKGKYLTFFILVMHLIIFIYLKIFNDTVASQSVKAMLFRISIWILIILFSQIIPKYFVK